MSLTVTFLASGVIDAALPSPVLSFASRGTWPPEAQVVFPGGVNPGERLRYRYAASLAAMLAAPYQEHIFGGGTTNGDKIDLGLGGIVSPAQTFMQVQHRIGDTLSPASNIAKHGDTTAPTITSSATSSKAEMIGGVPQFTLCTVMTDEPCTLTLSGDDAELLEVVNGDVAATAFNIVLASGLPLDWEDRSTYSFNADGLDLAGLSVTQAITATVTDVDDTLIDVVPVYAPGIGSGGFAEEYTWEDAPIGVAEASRLLVIVVAGGGSEGGGYTPLVEIEINTGTGFVAAAKLAGTAGQLTVWQIAAPTGTTADIRFSGTSIQTLGIKVFAIYGAKPTPTHTAFLPNENYLAPSITPTIVTNGIAIIAAYREGTATPNWSNAVALGNVQGLDRTLAGAVRFAAGAVAVTPGWTNSIATMLSVSWEPL